MSKNEKLFLCTFRLKHKYHLLLNREFVKKVSACDVESAKVKTYKELKLRFAIPYEYTIASIKIEEEKSDAIIEKIKQQVTIKWHKSNILQRRVFNIKKFQKRRRQGKILMSDNHKKSMNNIKQLISFLNTFCDKQHNKEPHECCEGGCPNYGRCTKDIWQNAETELKKTGVLAVDEDIYDI